MKRKRICMSNLAHMHNHYHVCFEALEILFVLAKFGNAIQVFMQLDGIEIRNAKTDEGIVPTMLPKISLSLLLPKMGV